MGALLNAINDLDQSVAHAAHRAIPQIERFCSDTLLKMKKGGRLFYVGSGTSGRLGIVDASECPPTYGVDHGVVVGIIAGGDTAIRKAVEFAEDDTAACYKQLLEHGIHSNDTVVGISASGKTPYVLGAMNACKANGISTGCIVCNSDSAIAAASDFPMEVLTGPEFVRGSTRMKAGTGTKLALNMITTSLMIKLGHVKGNKMIDMQLSNDKLVDRGTRMVMEETDLNYAAANDLLLKTKSVRAAVDAWIQSNK
jgi:N-acetylmuramic acid 6-phosphate etherase